MSFGNLFEWKELDLKQDEIIAGKIFVTLDKLMMNNASQQETVQKINELLEQWAMNPKKRNMVRFLYQKLILRFRNMPDECQFVLPAIVNENNN